uniref:NADP-dependent oxidoreductase domain-containing protein n=1 Tax=Plectus sambesii TaxID=2011161 RepID=A0A914WIJ7_9BILA
MTVVPTVTLKSGEKIPVIGLGTWLSKPGEVAQALKIALKNGYRHIDCAHAYMNQDEIGQVLEEVIAQGTVKREELFITSKIWNTFHSYEKTKEAVDIILQQLKLKYVDLLLIHWPMGFQEGGEIFPRTADGNHMHYSDADYLDTWKALEEAVQAGKVKTIGLSNFNSQQIQRVIDHSHIQPAMLQIESHPYFQQTKLINFCKEKGIEVTAYSPLGNMATPFRKEGQANLLEDPVILEIAKHHNKSPAQVIIHWSIQRGVIVIPKSTSEHRLKENFDVFDFELSKDEMAKMAGIDRNWRILDLTARDGDHPHFPFNIEF